MYIFFVIYVNFGILWNVLFVSLNEMIGFCFSFYENKTEKKKILNLIVVYDCIPLNPNGIALNFIRSHHINLIELWAFVEIIISWLQWCCYSSRNLNTGQG